NALNNVVLPEPGRPAIPISMCSHSAQQRLDLGLFFQVFVLANEEAHALAHDLDAVTQGQPKLIGLVNRPLQRRETLQAVQGLHRRRRTRILPARRRLYTHRSVDRLWTPWRREFVEASADNRSTECFLCTLAAEGNDRANLILLRS